MFRLTQPTSHCVSTKEKLSVDSFAASCFNLASRPLFEVFSTKTKFTLQQFTRQPACRDHWVIPPNNRTILLIHFASAFRSSILSGSQRAFDLAVRHVAQFLVPASGTVRAIRGGARMHRIPAWGVAVMRKPSHDWVSFDGSIASDCRPKRSPLFCLRQLYQPLGVRSTLPAGASLYDACTK